MCNRPHKLLNEILEYCKSELPNEACGYLLGSKENISAIYPIKNRLHSPTEFEFVPEEQFKAIRETRKSNLEIIGVFHSHPNGKAYPSQKDIELADSNHIQLIVVPETNESITFKIIDGIIHQLT